MNRGDVEFTVSLNTSPAEQQLDKLYAKMRSTRIANSSSPFMQQVSNEYSQGFKMVGTPYDSGGNRFGVPSTKVLETALVTTAQTIQKFNAVVNTVIQLSTTNLEAYFRRINQPRIEYNGGGVFTPFTSNSYRPMEAQFHRNFWFDKYNINSPLDTKLLTYDKAFDMVGDSYMKMYPEVWTNSRYANGAYQMWQKTFNNNMLGLPAPSETTSQDNLTPEEQSEDIVEQDKKDNEELKEKWRLWAKIAGTVYAIRKVLQGLANLWKFGAETVSNVNKNLNEEAGYFSTDPEGALRANTDKTRGLLYAGIRNMGDNAPVSKAGMDYATSKITEMWTSAMSGRNVDARTAIDIQRLIDFYGLDFPLASILTGERDGRSATDIQLDVMKAVESQVTKLATTDSITKGQVIDSLKNILGEELLDAIIANANKNLKIDDPDLRLTLGELLMSHGGSTIASGKLTEATAKSVDALSELNEAIQNLKNTIVQTFAPAFVTVTSAMTKFVDWVNEKLNKVEGETNAIGEAKHKLSISSLTGNEYSRYRNFKQKEDDTKDIYKNKEKIVKEALRSNDPLKILDALYLSQPETKSAADIENLMIKYHEQRVGEAILDGSFDPLDSSIVIRMLARKKYTNKKGETFEGVEAFRQELANEENLSWNTPEIYALFNNPEGMNEHERLIAIRNFVKLNEFAREKFAFAFDSKGGLGSGLYDFNTGMSIFGYLYNIKNFATPEAQYEALQALAKESYKVLDNTINIEPKWTDRDNNGKVDLGEVDVTIVVKDQNGKTLTTQDLQGALQ